MHIHSEDNTLADNEALYIRYIYNLNVSNCLFRNNDAQLALVVINSNVEISGCEFYQNKCQTYLISISFEQVHNVTISNCLFRNNDAQLLIVIVNVLNVDISGCEFYQNKGQAYLIVTLLGSFFDMNNCSIYDNDIKDTIFHLESSNFQSMSTITNCLFSKNTFSWSIYYCSCTIINNITSSILSKTILVSTEFTSSSYLSPHSPFLLVCF